MFRAIVIFELMDDPPHPYLSFPSTGLYKIFDFFLILWVCESSGEMEKDNGGLLLFPSRIRNTGRYGLYREGRDDKHVDERNLS